MLLNKLSALPLAALFLTSACLVNADDDDASGETGDTNPSTTATTTTTSSTSSTTSTTDPTTTTDPTSTTEDTDSATEPTTVSDTDATGTGTGTGTDTDASGTSSAAMCGWGPLVGAAVPEGYQCGAEGEDPDGVYPLMCSKDADLTPGADCTAAMIRAEGCCDADGNVWFCVDPDSGGPMETEVAMEDCSE